MANSELIELDSHLEQISSVLKEASNDNKLFESTVNAPFAHKILAVTLGLGLMVLVLVNKKDGTVDRIALSDTEPAQGAVTYSAKPFRAINIPLAVKENLLVRAIETGHWQQTSDWKDTFTPSLPPEQARFNQAGAGIGCTVIYPFSARDGGALSFSYFKPLEEIGGEQHAFMKKYTALVDDFLSR